MANEEKIKRILRASVRPGKQVTERQLTEVVGKVVELNRLDESLLQKVASEVTKDSSTFNVSSIDMSDINNELEQ